MKTSISMLSALAAWLGLLAVPSQAFLGKPKAALEHLAAKDSAILDAVGNFVLRKASDGRMSSNKSEFSGSYPWAKCSTDPAYPVIMNRGETCPSECPFSQMVEGQSCDKLCVHASQCQQFHPVLFFADIRTWQCTPSCGAKEHEQIAGCAECLGPGICKRCARGLFGITQLELSEDGTRCINVSLKWWYLFYGTVAMVLLSLVAYIAMLARRPAVTEDGTLVDQKCQKKLETAEALREEARTELMRANEDDKPMEFWNCSFHNHATGSKRGGRGIVLYFNWLIFGMAVAFIFAAGNFVAYELSDLGRHKQMDKSCMETNPVEAYQTISTYMMVGDFNDVRRHESEKHAALEAWDAWWQQVADTVRASVRVVLNEAPPTGSTAARYRQFHERMFTASVVIYLLVVVGIFCFTAYQLNVVMLDYLSGAPQTRKYAAVVSGIPLDLFEGRRLTAFFREEVLAKQDLEKLWQDHGGTRKDELNHVPIEDRFHVVGTSIAYDFNLKQESVRTEIETWMNDLDKLEHAEDQVPIQVSTGVKSIGIGQGVTSQRDSKSRGIQTETRGDVLEQLREAVPQREDHPMFDDALMKFVGLEQETQTTLSGSGYAFVVFSTEAARDAVVALAQKKDFPKFTHRPVDASKDARHADNREHRLFVVDAHCEPVSVKWENFGPFSNFAFKVFLSCFIIFLTMVAWIALSLPSAIFIADLALIPGVRPGFVQNMMLGLLIAIGNQLIAVVVDLVTSWMGFLYKDSRDVAVLAMAFMGTLVATVFDLCIVAITAHGMVLEDAFHGRDAGYEPVVANELFGLTVPGYLVLPYLGIPIGEHVVPYFLARFLIRSHTKITQRSANMALRAPAFDICWRYSDILNNTTICVVLLFFTSNRAWMVMSVLLLFMVIIYSIDKYLLLHVATPTVYDTHRLSCAFAMWWCMPTTMIAGLVSYWGWRSGGISSFGICIAIPFFHAILYLTGMSIMERKSVESDDKEPIVYPDMLRKLQHDGRPWDFFNTNPVFCLRTRYLGEDVTGWKDIVRFQRKSWVDPSAGCDPGPGSPNLDGEAAADECVPFVRGSLRLLKPFAKTV